MRDAVVIYDVTAATTVASLTVAILPDVFETPRFDEMIVAPFVEQWR